MIVVAGNFPIDVARADELSELCSAVRAATLQEDGCHEYRFSFAADSPGTLMIFEEWRDQESLTAHLGAAHLAEFGSKIGAFVQGAPSIFRYEVTDKGPLR